MSTYKAPLRDLDFVLHELIRVQDSLAELPVYQEVTPDVFSSYFAAAAEFCEKELAPLNRRGDEEGCHFDSVSRTVTTPTGFKEAYRHYCALGFSTLDGDPAFGGQGMPQTLAFPIVEMQCASNIAWSMYPGLSRAAYSVIHTHGTAEQKAQYLPHLVSGEWMGTMCLTEAHCGSDLSLIKTRAVPNPKGGYAISGNKIFISAGEHDLTDNIIHLVLARLPGAPQGVKGLSLFIVPKFLHDGTRNPVYCGGLEHKMGIHGNATAVLHFEDAQGFLVGEPNKGLHYMFIMMNTARLGCGMQGLGLGEAAYQGALHYAQERLQMRAANGAKFPDHIADPIIVHPDVRRMLLTQKAYTEAGRALAIFLALQLDIEAKHPNPETRQEAADLVALLTPVAKAFITDNGYYATHLGMQVWGGHGYIREAGMEQLMRDCRISQIYEGTNGIQAFDLLGRKVLADQGQKLRKFTKTIHHFCIAHRHNEIMRPFVEPLAKLITDISDITMHIGIASVQDRNEIGAAAHDYLRLIGHLTYAWLWARTAKVVSAQLAVHNGDPFYQAKLLTARFYYAKLLPEVHTLTASIRAGAQTLMAFNDTHGY